MEGTGAFLDNNAYLGGFAAALVEKPVWEMNVVTLKNQSHTRQ